MNMEKKISEEVAFIAKYRKEALSQVSTQNRDRVVIPADYKVLFILMRNLVVNGTSYTVASGSTQERILDEAIQNFKYSVENFANNNVHIIPTKKVINDTVSISGRKYLIYEDIDEYLKQFDSKGLYDAVIVATKEFMGGAVTTLGSFQFDNVLHGFTHIDIPSADASSIGHSYDKKYPYLLTTNYCIHEWMHQLEGYGRALGVIYPDTHAYVDPELSGLTWNSAYFNDTAKYPHVVERPLTSFYRAVLSCEVTHNASGRYVGMYPLFWRLTPSKVFIGRYIIKNSAGNYLYNNNGAVASSASFNHNMKYYWNVYYRLSTASLVIQNFSAANATMAYNSANEHIRCGLYDEGYYHLVNTTLNKTLSYSVSGSTTSAEMTDYLSAGAVPYYLEHHKTSGNDILGFYKLSAQGNSNRFLDLYNIWDTEGNTVGLGGWTGYPSAQTWQFRNVDGDYTILPLASTTKGLSYYDGKLRITALTGNRIQTWRPEKVDNGKYILPGTYRIKLASGNYLSYNSSTNRVVTSSSGTIWTIEALSNHFYAIYVVINGTKRYFDVLNAYDLEGNVVQLQTKTGYPQAQSWKFMLQNDGTVIIVPLLSLTRGIAIDSSNAKISTSYDSFALVRA